MRSLYPLEKVQNTSPSKGKPKIDFLKRNEKVKNTQPEAGKRDITNSLLNQRLIVTNSSQLSLTSEKLSNERLLDIVLASANREDISTAASNAISMLNYKKFPFSGLNLNGINVPNAFLRDAIFDHTNLQDANLTNADMSRSCLWGANLRGVNMEKVKFNEYPAFKKHSKGINTVSCSSNGHLAASGGDDGKVYIWDISKPDLEPKELTGDESTITHVKFSPNDQYVAVANESKILKVYSLEKEINQPLLQEFPFDNSINSIAFHPDGKSIASGHSNGDFFLSNISTGEKKLSSAASKPQNAIACIAYSPNGQVLAVVNGNTNEISLHNAASEQQTKSQALQDIISILSMTFSLDSRIIAVSGRTPTDTPIIQLLDAESLTMKCPSLTGHTANVRSLVFSPDFKLISVSSDATIRVWNTEGKQIGVPLMGHNHMIMSVSLSSNGQTIVTGSKDRTMRIWDMKAVETVGSKLKGHTNWVTCLSAHTSPRRTLIATCSFDKTVAIWDAKEHVALGGGPIFSGEHFLRSVHFSPNGKKLICGDDNNTLRLFDVSTLKEEMNIQVSDQNDPKNFILSAKYSPNGKMIAIGSTDKLVRLYNAENLAPLFQPLKGHKDEVNGVCFSPDSRYLISCAAGSFTTWGDRERDTAIHLWDTTTGLLVTSSNSGSIITDVLFNPTGDIIAAVSQSSKTLEIFQSKTLDLLHKFPQEVSVSQLAYSSDGKMLAVASWEGEINVYETEKWQKIVPSFNRDVPNIPIYGIQFIEQDQQLVIVTEGGFIRFFKRVNGKFLVLAEISGTERHLTSCKADIGDAKELSAGNKLLLQQKGCNP